MIKSPFNYTGNKFKLLPQLKDLIPPHQRFFDVFGGGADMVNLANNIYYYNDISKSLVAILREMYRNDRFIKELRELQKQYNLYKGKQYKEGFLLLRANHNEKIERGIYNPLERFLLLKHTFNYQNRESQKGAFNNSHGGDKSALIYDYVISWIELLKSKRCIFSSFDFDSYLTRIEPYLTKDDFIYFDPPYLITNAYYNKGWSVEHEKRLYWWLDRLHSKGINWGLSNVLIHAGKNNEILKQFARRHTLYIMDYNYKNCMYIKNNKSYDRCKKTQEVYITNQG